LLVLKVLVNELYEEYIFTDFNKNIFIITSLIGVLEALIKHYLTHFL